MTSRAMPARASRASRSAVAAVLLALMVAACLTATATIASAHAELVSSTPEGGTSVKQMPGTVTLTFSETVRTPAFVEVLGPDGEDVSTGQTQVRDAEVLRQVGGDPAAGDYAMSYRVTSADGHPISGTVRFTVQGEAGGGAGASAEPTSEPTTEPRAGPTTESTTGAGGSGSDDGGLGTAQLVLLLAALAVGLAALAVGTRRALHHSAAMAQEAKGPGRKGGPRRR